MELKKYSLTYSVELFERAKLGSNQLVHSPTWMLIEFFSRSISLICLRNNVVFTDFGALWFPMPVKQISVLFVFSAQLISSAKLNSKKHTKVNIQINILLGVYELHTVVSWGSEATPSATPFFKRAYKISHPAGL